MQAAGRFRMLVVNSAHPNSPASLAGLLSGDVITKVGPYDVVDAVDLERRFTFRLQPDGTGSGTGPDGVDHPRFRAWKESLRDDA